MPEADAIQIMRDALFITLKVAAPMLIISMMVGLVISILQTTTSIQEQTLTFVPKLVAVFFSIVIFSAFILHTVVDYTRDMYMLIIKY